MNDTLGEQLSAFLDGELLKGQVGLLLRRLDGEPQLREAIARYAAMGECLRGQPDSLSRDFTARVCQAVAREAGGTAPGFRGGWAARPWLRKSSQLAGGMAVAATVAGIAILLLQRDAPPALEPVEQWGMQLLAEAPFAVSGAENLLGELPGNEIFSYTVPVRPVSTAASPLQRVSATRLTDYVFAHSEYSSLLGRRNILSGVVAEDPAPGDSSELDMQILERQ